MPTPRPDAARQLPQGRHGTVVDQSFVAIRAKLIDVAAFLDRAERHGAADDYRAAALRAAAVLLVDGQGERARRILESLSDPTTAPDEVSTGKAATGAWRPRPE